MQARGLACRLVLGLWPLLALLSGCEGRNPDPPDSALRPSAAEPPTMNPAAIEPAHPKSPEQAHAARISQLNAELAAMEAEKTQLLQRREAVNARLASHEEQGDVLIASLKREMQEQGRANDAAFKLQARAKLEAALAEDNELTASISDLDAQVALLDNRIAELNAQLDFAGQQEIVQSDL